MKPVADGSREDRGMGRTDIRGDFLSGAALSLSLSRREREVLDELMKGGSNKAIAEQLSVSPKTVETHLCNILE